MKKILLTLCLVALAASPVMAWTAAGGGVVGSMHDMNQIGGATDDAQNRVCAFCHTPHHAIADVTGDQQPLWSHEYTGYINNFVSYDSPTLDATIVDPLMGPSRLCMSCHDGVVAVDQHYGTAGTKIGIGGDDFGGRDIGLATAGSADFSNDHPIGFSYTTAQANDVNGGLFEVDATDRSFIGNSVKIKDVLLNGEFLTCATCHDVHNKDNATNTANVNYFVYAAQDGSALCLSCHDKGDGN